MEQAIVPLIFTSIGNIPISDLEYSTDWHISAEEVGFRETYKLHGEVVKQSVHIQKLKGQEMGAEQVQFGG
jgi:hypothetical protein